MNRRDYAIKTPPGQSSGGANAGGLIWREISLC
jgi:hypothetical protein